MFIIRRCGRLWECLPTLQHDPNRPEDALKVDAGDLLIPASSPSTTTPGPPPPPVLPGVATVDSKAIHRVTQPRSLTFDKPHKCFYVEVENFTYLVEPPSGSSRPSGVVK